MDPNQENESNDYTFEIADDEAASVDDFIRELEAKEKDLHITAETTFIEIAADFDDEAEAPDFMRQDLAENKSHALKPVPMQNAAGTSQLKTLEGEIATLRAKITNLEDERTELYKNSQRRLKDFEAYKARTERERGDTFQRQLRNLATQMLPALDNLDRALQCASDMSDEKQVEFAQFFDGIVLVNQQVNEVLVNMGIDPIMTVGHPFDPHLHEAVAIDENSDLPPNTITAEMLRGFRIGDNVIRHSMVKVSKADASFSAAAPAQTGETESFGSESGNAEGSVALENSSGSTMDAIEFELANDTDFDEEFAIEQDGETR